MLSGLAALGAMPAAAQAPGRRRLVGWLSPSVSTAAATALFYRQAFVDGLAQAGWIDGRDYDLVSLFAENQFDRLPTLAREMVARNVDVIATGSTQATVDSARITSTIPIVFGAGADPVPLGLAVSHNRPGRNVTGILSALSDGFAPKQLQLGQELVPGAKRVGVLFNPSNPSHAEMQRAAVEAAAVLGITLVAAGAASPEELDTALRHFAAERVELIEALTDNLALIQSPRIVALANAMGVGVIGTFREQAAAGFAVSYGPSLAGNFRRAAQMTDRILRGAKPADIPIEFPTTFDVVVNLKAAKARGITVPETILLRATEIIE